jgi:hypothetical protein
MVSWDSLLNKLKAKFKELEEEFEEEKSKECIQARDAIVRVLKENRVSLPAAIFALEIVKWELLRAQYEEFMGRVLIPKESIPLADTKPTEIKAK